MTTRLESARLMEAIKVNAAKAKHRYAVIAYVSTDSLVRFKKDDVLVVDASEPCVRAGQTSASVLHRAVRSGAEVYSLPGIHAKVLVCDDTAIVGSANLSAAAAEPLREAGLISNDPAIVKQARDLVRTLSLRAAPRLTQSATEALLRIPVDRAGSGPRSGSQRSEKPSLLQALRADHRSLSDFAFFFWQDLPIASDAEVKREARQREIILPDPSLLDRFEDEDLPANRSLYERVFKKQRRLLISFEVTLNEDTKCLNRFVALDRDALSYAGHYSKDKKIQGLFSKISRLSVKLNGGDAKTLCAELNRGLKRHPKIGERLYRSEGGKIRKQDLMALLS